MLRIIKTKRTDEKVVITLFPVADQMEINDKLRKVAVKWSHIYIMITSYDPCSMELEVIFKKWQ